jgi:fido (protein-threonine AMPylation protein)
MINERHSEPENKVPTSPFYTVTLQVTTSVDPKSSEFIPTLHKRIQSGIYVFVGAKRCKS